MDMEKIHKIMSEAQAVDACVTLGLLTEAEATAAKAKLAVELKKKLKFDE